MGIGDYHRFSYVFGTTDEGGHRFSFVSVPIVPRRYYQAWQPKNKQVLPGTVLASVFFRLLYLWLN